MAKKMNAEAWNNFVLCSQPGHHPAGSSMRSAAIAKSYMGLANNGGICHFLSCSCDLDAAEVLESLSAIGALTAAAELSVILRALGTPLPPSNLDARIRVVGRHWSKALNEHDALSIEANKDLMAALERHVLKHEEFYLLIQ